MLNKKDFILIGKLVKSHGIKGEAILRLNKYNFEDIIKMESIFLEYEGLLVPFFLEYYIEKQPNEVICKFDDIEKEEELKDFFECDIYIEKNNIKSPNIFSLDTNKIIGFLAIDIDFGEIGIIEETIEIENNPQLRVTGKKKEILIPINSDFIVKIDTKNKTVFINTPEGFLDIF